ncbi:MAG TPA: Rossmann-like and DUF2520 domain-containing protein [Pyrinomonadaceae bacterium]|nr:Rossmann-like and DUF2520 domain-containing protein [Pyrinomonadaceae bacterium]
MTAKRHPGRKPKLTARRRGQRLSVSIIGAGRLGTALAIALDKAGHSINLIVASHAATARRASKLAGGQGLGLSAKQFRQLLPKHRELLEQSSLILIATPDDMIASIAEELAVLLRFRTAPAGRQVALHTSGALSSNVLEPLRQSRISVGALHPLVSISEARGGAEWLTRAFFSVEGDAAATRAGKRIVRDLGGHTFTIAASAKPLYHAAALMASPNLTALVDIALEMLNHCGLSANQSRKVLLPLIKSTIDNLAVATPSRSLTGTFKRGDVATVQKHVDAISSQRLFDALEAYVLLGRRSMKLANPKSASRTEIDHILAQALSRTRGRR